MRIILLVLASLLTITGAAAAQETPAPAPARMPSVALPPEIDRVLRDYEREWEAGNAAALARLFTEDGFVLRPGHPPVRGRAAIEESYQGASGDLRLRALAYSAADSLGHVIGAYAYGSADAPDTGKFILTLRRGADGRWLISADMDNGNAMPRRPAPPQQ
jgi:ketosteroid isomerase-like protein